MSDWYCPLPFKHAYIDSSGVAACCNTRRYPVSLDSWSADPHLLALQEKFNNKQIPIECNTCVKQENAQGRSLRTDANRDYHNQVFTETAIDFVDYRSSNICNFKCRSCEPAFSHGIDQEAKSNPELAKFYYDTNATKTVSISQDNQQWIMDNITKIKRLMITGGEPTVIPGIKDIVKMAVEQNPTINILITTNGSFTDQFWYDITVGMPNLHWTLSLDAVGSAAETIRHGTDWPVVEHNARWLAQHSHSFDINTVVSNLNLLQLGSLLEFVNQLKPLSDVNGCVHQFHIVQRPYMLAADNIPDDLKPKVIAHLNSCLQLSLDEQQHNMIAGLIAQITKSSPNQHLLKKAHEFNTVLDCLRNEDYTSLYQQ